MLHHVRHLQTCNLLPTPLVEAKHESFHCLVSRCLEVCAVVGSVCCHGATTDHLHHAAGNHVREMGEGQEAVPVHCRMCMPIHHLHIAGWSFCLLPHLKAQ